MTLALALAQLRALQPQPVQTAPRPAPVLTDDQCAAVDDTSEVQQ